MPELLLDSVPDPYGRSKYRQFNRNGTGSKQFLGAFKEAFKATWPHETLPAFPTLTDDLTKGIRDNKFTKEFIGAAGPSFKKFRTQWQRIFNKIRFGTITGTFICFKEAATPVISNDWLDMGCGVNTDMKVHKLTFDLIIKKVFHSCIH